MSGKCLSCGSTDLRVSRFRLKDISRLILFQYPMRCWVCRHRDHQPLLHAFCRARKTRPRPGSRTPAG